MMGISVDEHSFVFGDNQSILANTTRPESQIKKKTQSITYHHVCKGYAKYEWCITYVNTHENMADLLMKPLPSGEKHWKFVGMLLHQMSPKTPAAGVSTKQRKGGK